MNATATKTTFRVVDGRTGRTGYVRARDAQAAAAAYGLRVDDNGDTFNRYGAWVGRIEAN